MSQLKHATSVFSLCAPARDGEIKARQGELEALLSSPTLTFGVFVVPFLKSFHVTVDEIEVSGHLSAEVSGHLSAEVSGHLSAEVSGHLSAEVSGHLSAVYIGAYQGDTLCRFSTYGCMMLVYMLTCCAQLREMCNGCLCACRHPNA
jgi:hypothetical protein